MIRVLLLVLALAVPADAYSLLEERVEKGSLERCIRRCEKNNPAAPTPQPTQSPVPVQCEPGRYVLKIVLNEANNVACSTLTFTVR